MTTIFIIWLIISIIQWFIIYSLEFAFWTRYPDGAQLVEWYGDKQTKENKQTSILLAFIACWIPIIGIIISFSSCENGKYGLRIK